MDKIRIWFKDAFYSDYYENVTNWDFDGDFFVISQEKKINYIKLSEIKQILIGSMEEGEDD